MRQGVWPARLFFFHAGLVDDLSPFSGFGGLEFEKSPPTADEETRLKEAKERVSRLHTACRRHILDERWERLQKNVKDLRPVLRARVLEGIMAEHAKQGFDRIGLDTPAAACDLVVDQAVNLPPEHLARFLPRFLSLFQGFMGSASHLKEHEAMAALIEVMHGCVLKMPAESCGDMLIQLIGALNNLLTSAHFEGRRLSAAAIERIEACFSLLAGSLDRIAGAGESAAKEKMVACEKMIGRFK
ncbi:MAG: hypothetical protein JWQ23_888 [Herminiimonas sp.]|nr:hypothetical protein [Herminiimonas sp.]